MLAVVIDCFPGIRYLSLNVFLKCTHPHPWPEEVEVLPVCCNSIADLTIVTVALFSLPRRAGTILNKGVLTSDEKDELIIRSRKRTNGN